MRRKKKNEKEKKKEEKVNNTFTNKKRKEKNDTFFDSIHSKSQRKRTRSKHAPITTNLVRRLMHQRSYHSVSKRRPVRSSMWSTSLPMYPAPKNLTRDLIVRREQK
jgi:hypothetical protein